MNAGPIGTDSAKSRVYEIQNRVRNEEYAYKRYVRGVGLDRRRSTGAEKNGARELNTTFKETGTMRLT